MIDIYAIGLDFFLARIERRNPITFVRYGDGEFKAILGEQGENCDGHTYFPDLGTALRRTLTQPRMGDYMYAIGPKAARNLGMSSVVQGWLEQQAPSLLWNTSEVFLHASLNGELRKLILLLQEHKTLLLGPPHLQPMTQQLRGWTYVAVPEKNAWLERDAIKRELVSQLGAAEVVLLCAGMLSKVLAWELYPLLNARVTFLDMGSVFDMYCGKDSRTYARRMSTKQKEQLRHANFGNLLQESYAI